MQVVLHIQGQSFNWVIYQIVNTCKELNLAWKDSPLCSLRRPNPTYVLFAHGTVC